MVDEPNVSLGQRLAAARAKVEQSVVALGSGLLAATIGAFTEDTATGLARVHRILHDAEAGPFFRRLGCEVGELVEKGRVKAERVGAPEVRTTLAAITEDLEKQVPDQRRLETLRRAFLAVLLGDPADPAATMALVFVHVATKLAAEDGAVLASAYRHRSDFQEERSDRTRRWLTDAEKETGLMHEEPLRRACVRLHELGLFRPPNNVWPNWKAGHGPLTEYGLGFCEFLQRAEPFAPPVPTPPSG
jgi:hypothetical protein